MSHFREGWFENNVHLRIRVKNEDIRWKMLDCSKENSVQFSWHIGYFGDDCPNGGMQRYIIFFKFTGVGSFFFTC